eukprot:GFYU01013779.1.p1 GENE.GFYU01013779.1~~GFYU01013779.1.p1  ORF type:complete len:268 (-),score=9.80 GFYU01013779.1:15-818(-)
MMRFQGFGIGPTIVTTVQQAATSVVYGVSAGVWKCCTTLAIPRYTIGACEYLLSHVTPNTMSTESRIIFWGAVTGAVWNLLWHHPPPPQEAFAEVESWKLQWIYFRNVQRCRVKDMRTKAALREAAAADDAARINERPTEKLCQRLKQARIGTTTRAKLNHEFRKQKRLKLRQRLGEEVYMQRVKKIKKWKLGEEMYEQKAKERQVIKQRVEQELKEVKQSLLDEREKHRLGDEVWKQRLERLEQLEQRLLHGRVKLRVGDNRCIKG